VNIFVDLHHDSLFTSLQLLWEKRLNFNLYRPIGEDWFTSGYWKLAEVYGNNPATITQYLGIRDTVPVTYRQLNEIEEARPDYYRVKGNPYDHKAVTFEQFCNMKFDIVIASLQTHIDPYIDLVAKHQPQAKFVHQMGNEWGVDYNKVKNLLASTKRRQVPAGVNAVFYHQEFPQDLYSYKEPDKSNVIRSFVNCLTEPSFHSDWQDFLELEKALPYIFESYGASCRNGAIQDQVAIARMMQDSLFGFHLKTGGDGYGHVITNWFSVGRPVIVRKSQYKDRLADELLIDGVTCIDLDNGTLATNIERIKDMAKPDKHLEMCRAARKRYEEVVDFDKEEQEIRAWLDNLV